MDLDAFRWLLTDEGQALLARATELAGSDDELHVQAELRRTAPPAVALARPARKPTGYPAPMAFLEARRDANGRLLLAQGQGTGPDFRAAPGAYFSPLVP